jgi:pimeloyl-ACP methyl ester carboxylesterase
VGNLSGQPVGLQEGDQIAEFLGPAYGEVSPDGIDHFKVVATKIGDMAAVEPTLQASELAKVTCRSLVMFADDDLVTPQHMIDMYAALPKAELAIVPGPRTSSPRRSPTW